jgi:hypothetical protein
MNDPLRETRERLALHYAQVDLPQSQRDLFPHERADKS